MEEEQRETKKAEAIYSACQRFTAEYLLAFEDPGHSGPGIEFQRLDEVVIGDRVHKSCCSWHAAQDIQHSPPEMQRTAADFSKFSYKALLVLHLKRVLSVQ